MFGIYCIYEWQSNQGSISFPAWIFLENEEAALQLLCCRSWVGFELPILAPICFVSMQIGHQFVVSTQIKTLVSTEDIWTTPGERSAIPSCKEPVTSTLLKFSELQNDTDSAITPFEVAKFCAEWGFYL